MWSMWKGSQPQLDSLNTKPLLIDAVREKRLKLILSRQYITRLLKVMCNFLKEAECITLATNPQHEEKRGKRGQS